MKQKRIVFSIIVIVVAVFLSLAYYFDIVEASSLIPSNTELDLCTRCHSLGVYLKAPRETICSSCHEYRFAPTEYIHQEHIQGQGFDCTYCHSGQMIGHNE